MIIFFNVSPSIASCCRISFSVYSKVAILIIIDRVKNYVLSSKLTRFIRGHSRDVTKFVY